MNDFILVADKTIKLWKVSERDKRAEGYNLKEDNGLLRDPNAINTLRVRVVSNAISFIFVMLEKQPISRPPIPNLVVYQNHVFLNETPSAADGTTGPGW